MPIIAVSGLAHTYLAGTPLASVALRDVSLRAERGEVVAVMGETGSGKTTLLQFLNGLLRPAATGVVRVLGTDTASATDRDLRQLRLRAGLLLQRAEAQLIERFVGDDVAFGPRQLNLGHEEVRERVRLAMEAVGLGFEEFKDRRSFSLSGGEMKKVALAGLLAMRPDLLLLDEPTAGLDPESRQSLLALIRCQADAGATVVLASTNMEDLPGVVDRLVVLDKGRTVGELSPGDIWQSAAFLRQHALDLPEAALVLELLAERGMAIAPPSLDPDEIAEEICRTLPTSAT